MRTTLSELLHVAFEPLLSVLNCIATSRSPNPWVQVDACLHRRARYCNPHRTRITATWQVNSHESSNQGAGKGTRAVGSCHGRGGGSAEAGAAAGAERSSQAAQMSPAKGGRRLRGRNGASCLACLTPSDGKVPGIFGMLPPPQAKPERGRVHREVGETSRSPSPSKVSAEQVTLVQKKKAFR